jgi:hypothetical protein
VTSVIMALVDRAVIGLRAVRPTCYRPTGEPEKPPVDYAQPTRRPDIVTRARSAFARHHPPRPDDPTADKSD